MHFKADCS